jgi:hypothetical protein
MDFADSGHIRRLGDDIVNSYLIADAAGVTIVDAGVPGYLEADSSRARPDGQVA